MRTIDEMRTLLVSAVGHNNVYFQPDSNIRMSYPAVIFKWKAVDTNHADNAPYKQDSAYEVVVVDFYPDTKAVLNLLKMPMSKFDRQYVADNLYHTTFTIY